MTESKDYEATTTESPEQRIKKCNTLDELVSVILVLPELKNSQEELLDVTKVAEIISALSEQIKYDPEISAKMNANLNRLDEFERSLTRTYGIRQKVFELAGLNLDVE